MSTIWQVENIDRKRIHDDVRDLLEKSQAVDWLGDTNAPVFLKPNLVVAKPSSSGATTTPEIAEGLILYLKDRGYNNLSIAESSWVGESTDKAFRSCGYYKLAKKYGIKIHDLKKDKSVTLKTHGENLSVCRSVYELLKNECSLINLPVLKGHGQTLLTCALKNLKGCIPDSEKRRYHTLGVHRPVALLNTLIKPAFALVDGLNGDPGWEEGGSPENHNLIFLGKDPVSIDSYASTLLDLRPEDIDYIGMAEQLGIGTRFENYDLILLNTENMADNNQDPNNYEDIKKTKAFLDSVIIEDSACSACYGNLSSVIRDLVIEGKSEYIPEKLYIGQGYNNRRIPGNSVGIGLCASDAFSYCKGCPPSRSGIRTFLTGDNHAN